MKKNCTSCCKGCCAGTWIMWALLIIGGLNWGLVGIGLFTGGNLNVVNLIFGKVIWLEAIIYFLVALSAIVILAGGCRCKKCKKGVCKDGVCMPADKDCADCESGSCAMHMTGEGKAEM